MENRRRRFVGHKIGRRIRLPAIVLYLTGKCDGYFRWLMLTAHPMLVSGYDITGTSGVKNTMGQLMLPGGNYPTLARAAVPFNPILGEG